MKSFVISSLIASAPVAAIPQAVTEGGAFVPTPDPGTVVVGQSYSFSVTSPEDLEIFMCARPPSQIDDDCFVSIYSGPAGPVDFIVPEPQQYGYTCDDDFFFRSTVVSGGFNYSGRFFVTGCAVCTCPDDPACNPIPDPCTDPNGYCNGNGNGTSPVSPVDPSCPGGYDANGACISPIIDPGYGCTDPNGNCGAVDPNCPSGNYDYNNVCVDPIVVNPVPCDGTSPVPPVVDPTCPDGYDANGNCVSPIGPIVDPGYGCTDPNGNCGAVDPTCPDGYDANGNCVNPVIVDPVPCDGTSPVPAVVDPTCPDGYDANGNCVSPIGPIVDPGYGCTDPNGSCDCPSGIYDDNGVCCWSGVVDDAGFCVYDDDDSDDDDTAGIPSPFPNVDFTTHCGPAPTDPTVVADYVHNCMFKLVATVFVDICATINITAGVGVGTGGNPFTY